MSDQSLRTTPLHDRHERAGARFAPFAGWRMPLEYRGTRDEHLAVREACGVFDVSHLGTLDIRGRDAMTVVARSFTNDPARVDDGGSQYTLCVSDEGGVIDDLIVYRLHAQRWLAMPNAANLAAVTAIVEQQARDHDVEVADVTLDRAVIAVQGPTSDVVAAQALGTDVAGVPRLGIDAVDVDGHTVRVARTGYTGERGVELLVPVAVAGTVWDGALAAGGTPAGLGARDTLRLEMGYPLHGNDLTRSTTPFEARLSWAVALDHDEFHGRDALLRAPRPPARRLWGLRGRSRRPFRAGMAVEHDGAVVGEVTSGSSSPVLQVGIALAYLADPLGPGDEVVVDVRGRAEPADVVKPPFVASRV